VVFLMIFVTSIYVFIHCVVLSMRISTLHFAIDGELDLITLLFAVKSAELKSGILRVIEKNKIEILEKMCLSDVVDRFKWFIALILIFADKFVNHPTVSTSWVYPFFLGAALCWISEMSTDWIKHGSIAMVNDWLSGQTYRHIRLELLGDYHHTSLGDPMTFKVSQHFDFVTLPMTCLIVRLIWRNWNLKKQISNSWLNIIFVFILLFLIKIIIRISLRFWANIKRTDDDIVFGDKTKQNIPKQPVTNDDSKTPDLNEELQRSGDQSKKSDEEAKIKREEKAMKENLKKIL